MKNFIMKNFIMKNFIMKKFIMKKLKFELNYLILYYSTTNNMEDNTIDPSRLRELIRETGQDIDEIHEILKNTKPKNQLRVKMSLIIIKN